MTNVLSKNPAVLPRQALDGRVPPLDRMSPEVRAWYLEYQEAVARFRNIKTDGDRQRWVEENRAALKEWDQWAETSDVSTLRGHSRS